MEGSFNTCAALAVVFPPTEFIQRTRQEHDRAFKRWMPHVNLIFPFVNAEDIDDMVARLTKALASFPPFEADMGTLGMFKKRDVTFHLKPGKGHEQFLALSKAVHATLSEIELKRAFQPHLTLGQCRKKDFKTLGPELETAIAEQKLAFPIRAVSVVQRGPDTPFRVTHTIPLGGADR